MVVFVLLDLVVVLSWIVMEWALIAFICNFVIIDCLFCRHHEQHTAATMHHRCLHMTHAILLFILFFCCLAHAVFMIFSALPVPHTLQPITLASLVALRCRHLWSVFLI
jgi:hypothetical protein